MAVVFSSKNASVRRARSRCISRSIRPTPFSEMPHFHDHDGTARSDWILATGASTPVPAKNEDPAPA